MFRGDVKVILYDENGKEIQKSEAHNLVTNATAELLTMIAGRGAQVNSIMPIAEKALGGLLLFDSALDDSSASNFSIPSSAKIIGCAARDVDTSNTRRGSFNSAESEKTLTGYKSVWDFSTSQMNNTRISALALTSVACGEDPFNFHNRTGLYNISGSAPLIPALSSNPQLYAGDIYVLKYDKTTQLLYFLRLAGGSKNQWVYNLCTVRMPFYSYKVADSVYAVDKYTDTGTSFTLPSILLHDGSVDVLGSAVSGSNTRSRRAYYKYDVNSTYTDQITGGVLCCIGIDDFTKYTDVTMPYNTDRFCVSNGFLYYVGEQHTSVISKEIGGGGTQDKTYTGLNLNYNYLLVSGPGGVVYCCCRFTGSSDEPNYALYPDGSSTTIKNLITAPYADTGYYINDLLAISTYTSSHEIRFTTFNNYLGTIFNLQEAVQKTPATTMKVIYTLTDVSS